MESKLAVVVREIKMKDGVTDLSDETMESGKAAWMREREGRLWRGVREKENKWKQRWDE